MLESSKKIDELTRNDLQLLGKQCITVGNAGRAAGILTSLLKGTGC